jgi:hypothetical protein
MGPVEYRIVRRSADLYEVSTLEESFPSIEGRWKFTAKGLAELAAMVDCWLQNRLDFGWYRMAMGASGHGYTYYYKPGMDAHPLTVSLGEISCHRRASSAKFAGGIAEREMFVNGRKHVMARAFEWQDMVVYWSRERISFFRSPGLSGKAESTFLACGMTIQLNTRSKGHMVMDYAEALYISEVAKLAGHGAKPKASRSSGKKVGKDAAKASRKRRAA